MMGCYTRMAASDATHLGRKGPIIPGCRIVCLVMSDVRQLSLNNSQSVKFALDAGAAGLFMVSQVLAGDHFGYVYFASKSKNPDGLLLDLLQHHGITYSEVNILHETY